VVTSLPAAPCAAVGLAAGPFLNRVIDRVPRREPVWAGGLDGLRLWPASRVEAFVDVATAALFAGGGLRLGWSWALPAYLVFFGALVAVSVIDLRHYLIPNRVVYPALAVSLPLLVVASAAGHSWDRLFDALLGAAAAWALLLLVHVVSPRGMGFGDVRLAFVLGLFLGWLGLDRVVLGLFLGFLLGAVAGVGLILLRRRTRKDSIPFGPFLALGALIAVLAGDPLIRWYLG
jgi:leader peptidase (prepilin peptidase)/N-methyltransferase